jgi:signal transduction histidine kinase/DNA-binding response OmpR family regulator/HAMP domain-containing protein
MKNLGFHTLFRGLSRQVLLWFLIISLLPLTLVSSISYYTAKQDLNEATFKALTVQVEQKVLFIRNWFNNSFLDLTLQATSNSSTNLLKSLSNAYQHSDKSLNGFINSDQWEKLSQKWQPNLKAFRQLYGYYDIFLIDTEGNILFTLAKESDLGTNLFTGQLANTSFARTVKKTIKTGESGFSDLVSYAPSNYNAAAFFTHKIVNESGKTVGVYAFQSDIKQIKQAMQQSNDVDTGVQAYVIGYSEETGGTTLRTTRGSSSNTQHFLKHPISTEQSKRWLKKFGPNKINAATDDVSGFIYKGPNGTPVLGIHRNISILDVNWGIITEIPENRAFSSVMQLQQLITGLVLITSILVILVTIFLTHHLVLPISTIATALSNLSKGDTQQRVNIKAKHELGTLVEGFNHMIKSLQDSTKESETQHWLQEGNSHLKDVIQGDLSLEELASNVISFLCRYLDAPIGLFYIIEAENIKSVGSYPLYQKDDIQHTFKIGEGFIGQAVYEQQQMKLANIPADYMVIRSGIGETSPKIITAIPIIWNKRVVALLEFGTLQPFETLHSKLIEMVAPSIAIAVLTALSREQSQTLLEHTQAQAEELMAREEELRNNNSLLESQTKSLKHSELMLRDNQKQLEESNAQLQAQQEELRVANTELESRASDLKSSHNMVEKKNQHLEQARYDLEQKAEELAQSSRYKSEFLANMSHELRTPLNSILILARLLAENKEGSLSNKQAEYSQTIHDSGSDLLSLINDILDLSKIESGKVELQIDDIELNSFASNLEKRFSPLAQDKHIAFKIDLSHAPEYWHTDAQKLGQIVKNLLSNAIKFTSEGEVVLKIRPVDQKSEIKHLNFQAEKMLAIAVTDSGIGIAKEKCKAIFEAFQQADGTTSRKYGGTGLGLSISREIAKLLGGELQVESTPGQGSTFTLYLPNEITLPVKKENSYKREHLSISDLPQLFKQPKTDIKEPLAKPASFQIETATSFDESELTSQIPDDRDTTTADDRSILIIEDDKKFASILADTAREHHFKVLIAEDGESSLHLADFYQPSGIILDVNLPGMDGWQVMQRLKDGSKTRHIPVHFISGTDSPKDVLTNGAIGFLTKPVSMADMEEVFSRITHIIDHPIKQLLLIEDDSTLLQSMCELLSDKNLLIVTAKSGAEARKQLAIKRFDCIVLDLGLPDMSGIELIETLQTDDALKKTPVVIYTGKDLDAKERATLDRYAHSIIKKDANSLERLLDDTTLFLHRVESKLPEDQQRVIRMLHDSEAIFNGKKVLLVDDDMRNVFALSAVLQEKNMHIVVAKNGIEALDKLTSNPDAAIILMDIMMPEMDGYEAMQEIRKQAQFQQLPIIALTAKAMKGDRNRCIKAGASDYMAKPVNSEKLLSMMRVWLYQ